MRILDRYIVTSYVKKLVWAILAAIMVFIVVNLVEQLDKFIDSNVPASVVIRYYYLFVPYIVYLIFPVATLLATLFTIGGMTMRNELMVVYISGIPFIRVLSLILAVAVVGSVGVFVLGEMAVPDTSRKQNDIIRYQVKKIPRESRVRQGRLYLQISPGRQLYIDHYRPNTREAYGIEIIEVNDGRMKRRIDAEKMVWRDDMWFLQGSTEHIFNQDGSITFHLESDSTVYGMGLEPDSFERIQTKPEEMSWMELNDFVQRQKQIGGSTLKWEVELKSKVALPAAAIIIVLFGAPIASVKRRAGTALSFGIALFVCFIYFGFIQVGKSLGINGTLTPWFSAWIGNIFFGLLGIILLVRAYR